MDAKSERLIPYFIPILPPLVQMSEAMAVCPIPIPTFPLKGKESLDRQQRNVFLIHVLEVVQVTNLAP